MKEVLELLESEKQYVLTKIRGAEVNIEAITELMWKGDLQYEEGRIKELKNQVDFLDIAISRVKYKMLKMTEGIKCL